MLRGRDVVSGMGKNASRTDKNLTARVQRTVNDAKIQNAPGGAYGERSALQELSSATTSQTPTPMGVVARGEYIKPQLPGVGIFEPTQKPEEPVTAGVDNGTPGVGSAALRMAPDAPDQLSVLVRAMFAQNPTPQLLRLLEAFNQEGR